MFGEIAFKLPGSTNNKSYSFSNLSLTSLSPSQPVLTDINSQLISGTINLASTLFVSGLLSIANGGTGTSSPSLLGGSGITISGSWPNQTITANGGNLVAGTNISISGNTINVVNAPTFSGLVTANGGLTTATINASSSSSLKINTNANSLIYNSTNTNVNFTLQQSGTTVGYLHYNSTNGMALLNGAGTTIFNQKTGGSTDQSLQTANNTLDDGSGNATLLGNLTIDGLTASQAVITNASKELISIPYVSINSSFGGTSNLVARDTNGNTSFNNHYSGFTGNAATGTITLTVASTRKQVFTSGSGSAICVLPDATTLQNGWVFEFDNNASGTITVEQNGGGTLATMPSGSYLQVFLTSNSFAAGQWDYHWILPKNAQYGTAGLNITGTLTSGSSSQFQINSSGVITNGTWNAGIIPIIYGGTGTSTPGLIAGTGVSITGSWPNQTITANGANLIAGTNISISGNTISVINNPTFSGLVTANGGLWNTTNSSFDGNDGGSFPIRLFSSVTTTKELFLGYDSTNDCGFIYAIQDSTVAKPIVIGNILKTGTSISPRNILDDGSGNMTATGQIGASSSNILIKWDATNGTQVYDGHNSSIWLYQVGATSGSVRTAKTYLDDGGGNFIGQTDNTFLTQDTSAARIGLVKKSGSIGGFGSVGSNTINFYNFPTLSSFTSSGINANTPNVIFSIASNGATNTPHNTLDDGNGGCSLGANTSSPINIGTGSYSGTLTIGNSGSNPLVSILAGSGTLSLGNAGSGIVNLATSSFSGTFNIGSSSLSAFNISVSGISHGISLTQNAAAGSYAMTLIPNSTASNYRTAINFGFGTSDNWEIGTDSGANKTTDFYLYSIGTATYGFKISGAGVLNTNGYTTNSYNIVAGTNNPGIFLMYCGILSSSATLNLPAGQYVTAVLNSASSTQSITINAPAGYTFTGGSTSLNCSPGAAFQLYVCSPINLVSKILA